MNKLSYSEIKDRICGLISESTDFTPSELSERQTELLHKDLGIDSLTIIEVVLTIDQEFDVDFSEEELFMMESVERATRMVAERLENLKQAAPQ